MQKVFTIFQSIYFNLLYQRNRFALRVRRARYGKNLEIFTHFLLQDVSNVTIGDNVLIGRNCRFYGASGIIIGNDVLMANDVSIISVDHRFTDKKIPMNRQGIKIEKTPVEIGDDVLIGDKAIILKKVKIGKGAIIGAGAVVSKDVPPYSIAIGNPARVVKKRK